MRQGKGDKDRVVPIGERAIAWVVKYLADGRPELLGDGGTTPAQFVSRFGTRLTGSGLTKLANGYIRAADLGKNASCHVFRHSAATAMLENGADIRFIQEMLGHAKLTSTQVYTRVSITKLKAVHTATHPAALLEGRPGALEGDGEEAEEDGSRAREGRMARRNRRH